MSGSDLPGAPRAAAPATPDLANAPVDLRDEEGSWRLAASSVAAARNAVTAVVTALPLSPGGLSVMAIREMCLACGGTSWAVGSDGLARCLGCAPAAPAEGAPLRCPECGGPARLAGFGSIEAKALRAASSPEAPAASPTNPEIGALIDALHSASRAAGRSHTLENLSAVNAARTSLERAFEALRADLRRAQAELGIEKLNRAEEVARERAAREAAERDRDFLAKLAGSAIVIASIDPALGEAPAEEPTHALTSAVWDLVKERAAARSEAEGLRAALRRIKRESDEMHAHGARLREEGKVSPWFVTDDLDDAIDEGAVLAGPGADTAGNEGKGTPDGR